MTEEADQRVVWEKGKKKKRSRLRKVISRNIGYAVLRAFQQLETLNRENIVLMTPEIMIR